MNITNVDDGVYRGAHPSWVDDYSKLRDMGIKFTLDLQTGGFFGDGDPLSEANIADSYGIRTYPHPLGMIFPPSHSKLDAAVATVVKNKAIFIHCKDGVDRTGMVCAWYRMKVNKWSKTAAINEMRAFGMHPWYFYWVATL